MDEEARRTRTDRALDRAQAIGRRFTAWGGELVRNPMRLLTGGLCIVLIAVAIPLLIGGGHRLNTAWTEWRHERTVGRDWVRATGALVAVQDGGDLRLRVTYFDHTGDRHQAEVQVDSTGSRWIQSRMPIRYDPVHPSQVDLVGIAEANPLGSALIAGASVGAGLAALILTIGIWRRRRALAESRNPITVLRVPLALSGAVLALGLAAWAVGTVQLRGWTGVADRLGHHLSVAFGDMLGVTVPLLAFVIGCLLTAWLARHRDHTKHTGFLASVHGVIDHAANFVPSPEDMKVDARDESDESGAEPVVSGSEPGSESEPEPAVEAAAEPAPDPAPGAAPDESDPVRTG